MDDWREPLANLTEAITIALEDLTEAFKSFTDFLDQSVEPAPNPDPEPDPVPPPIPDPVPDPAPDPNPIPDPVPEPDPPGPPKQSIHGWNVGRQNYWSVAKIYQDINALQEYEFNRSDLIPAVWNRWGELIEGQAVTVAMTDRRRYKPGEYYCTIPGVSSRPTILVDDSDTLKYDAITLRGNCQGLMYLPADFDSETQSPFTSTFVQRSINAGVLRFMDLLMVNTSPNAPTIDSHYLIQDYGTSKRLIQTITPGQIHLMALELGCDVWFNFHHLDSDDRVRYIAGEFKRFGGDYKIYFEHSNEHWNFQFPVWQWLQQKFGTNWNELYKYHGTRSNQIGKIVKATLGDRAIMCIGTQAARYAVTELVLQADTEYCDYLSIAPYIGNMEQAAASDQELINYLYQYEQQQCREWIKWNQDKAASKNLKLNCYEGGTHIWPRTEVARKQFYQVNRSEEVAELYRQHIQFWNEQVGESYCWYNDCYGETFGHQEYECWPMQHRGQVLLEEMAKG